MYKRYFDDFAAIPFVNYWHDTSSGASTLDPKVYVVQTAAKVIQRCVLMVTDPGDLVLDPTCGSGTTAYVAELWGRRWITIDTSRVALALARARIMGARYPFYLLADSRDGQIKEAEVTRAVPSEQPTHGNIRHGFVYDRVPHITLKAIANNAEIDVIWDKWQQTLDPMRVQLNQALKKEWQEWEIPREATDPWPANDQGVFYTLKSEIEKGKEGNPAVIRDGPLFAPQLAGWPGLGGVSRPPAPLDVFPGQPRAVSCTRRALQTPSAGRGKPPRNSRHLAGPQGA
jgi:adenine-specific DNA-methyltransferase